MDYNILVNKDNPLSRAHIPNNLVNAESNYKENILVDEEVKKAFDKLKKEASKYNYCIDIESGYRDYDYQEKIYNKLVRDKIPEIINNTNEMQVKIIKKPPRQAICVACRGLFQFSVFLFW